MIAEPDRAAGDENAYEAHRSRFSSGLCLACHENEALPDDDLCSDCLAELVGGGILELIEEEAA